MTTNNAPAFSVLAQAKPAPTKTVTPKKDLPVNLALRLDRIEPGQGGNPSYFYGYNVDGGSDELVKVRMMTVAEGVTVNARQNEDPAVTLARVQGMYIGTGEKHRPKPGEINNPAHKTHCAPGGVMLFTKCLQNEDGSYRAHWAETLERMPGANCDAVMAHVRVRETTVNNVAKTQVFADVVNPQAATILNKDNVVATLTAALANTNGDEKRKPFAAVRILDPNTGRSVGLPPYRVDAAYREEVKEDADTGDKFSVHVADTPEASIKKLFDPESTADRPELLAVRAAIHGLSADGYPDFSKVTNDALKADLATLTDAVRTGQVVVEVIPGERINAGPATAASILKAVKGNAHHPVHQYLRRDDNGHIKEVLYAPTFLVTKLGPEGSRFFVKAIPVDLYPKARPLARLATNNDFKASNEAANERVADATAETRDIPLNAEPVNPAAMDTLPQDSLEAQLADSTKKLEEAGVVYD